MAGDRGALDLKALVRALARIYPGVEAHHEPFAFIAWENRGYLVDDARRGEAFDRLRRKTGLEPKTIARLGAPALAKLLEGSGIYPEKRAGRLKQIAGEIATRGGDLTAALKQLPAPK